VEVLEAVDTLFQEEPPLVVLELLLFAQELRHLAQLGLQQYRQMVATMSTHSQALDQSPSKDKA
jgi:hypothetical protein